MGSDLPDDAISLPASDPSPRMLEHIIRKGPAAMVITDPNRPDNPIVSLNPAFSDMAGYAEAVGRNCRFLQGEITDPGTVRRISDGLAREDEDEFELLNYRKDDTAFWNRLHMGPVHDETGILRFFVGTQRKVTARVTAEEESGLSAKRLANATEAARAVGTFDWDVGTDHLAVDETFDRAFGLDPAVAATGLPLVTFYEHVDLASRPGLEAAVNEDVRTGELFEHEYGVGGTDPHRWLLERGRCAHDEAGRPTRFAGVVVDITRREEAADALRGALEQAETAQREADHRVKTPFALVPAIVNLSARRATDAADLARRVQERVGPRAGTLHYA